MLSVEAVDLYYGASHALRRVSLDAEKGEVTCILGRNGVGKTSLLRAIFGLQPIRSGRISWEDRVLNGLSPHERARAGLALVPQGREIFPRLTRARKPGDRLRPAAAQPAQHPGGDLPRSSRC